MPVPDRLVAALADRYRILRELGQGGMATVFLAEDLKHDRKVAVKVLKPALAAVLGAERFVVEIKTTASLQHPHILPLFDSGEAAGFLFYVMPFIEGETLRDRLNRETQLSVDDAVRIAADVADALDYAHRHGVIHRDIKPENILLHDGRPMVADFGIALAVSAAAGGRMTETGLSLGTPHYMSPEQATAEKEISARSDVYSIASVCYEMLAGQPPHIGGSAQQIIMKIIAEPAAAVTQYRKSVPPHVAATLAKALEKLPADRFASAKDFRDSLLNPASVTTLGSVYLSGATVAVPATITRRYHTALAVAAVAVIAAVAGWLRPTPESDVTRSSLFLPDSQRLGGGNGTMVAISPDGRTIAYVSGEAERARILVRALDELRARVLPGTEGAINPSFSPDGQRIAFVTTRLPRAVKVVPVAGGPTVTLTDSLVDTGGLSWGEDGYIYYDGHLEGDGVARIRQTGGSPPEIATRPDSGESYHFLPSALPKGRGVLFTVRRGAVMESDIAVLDFRSGTKRILARGFVARYSPSGHLLVVGADGTLMATKMNLDRLELTGTPIPIAEGLLVHGNQRVDLDVSRSGAALYTSGGGASGLKELVWINREGRQVAVDPSYRAAIIGRVRLSPDGRSASLTIGTANARQVWVKRLDAGPASRATEQGGNASWHPDGRRLAFVGPGVIQMGPADGSSSASAVATVNGLNPSVSADGRWIAYNSQTDIWAIRLGEDSVPRRIVADNGSQTHPVFSPNGRWIAYASDETGAYQVFVRPFPDMSAGKWQVSIRGGFAPTWSRSGRELFFLSPDSLLAADVTMGSDITFGIPRPLFSTAALDGASNQFDVSPDGRRFLFVRSAVSGAGQPTEELVLVQNFAAELQAKVPR
jgi:eukaryotic-like serine/threonine-protein kinase